MPRRNSNAGPRRRTVSGAGGSVSKKHRRFMDYLNKHPTPVSQRRELEQKIAEQEELPDEVVDHLFRRAV